MPQPLYVGGSGRESRSRTTRGLKEEVRGRLMGCVGVIPGWEWRGGKSVEEEGQQKVSESQKEITFSMLIYFFKKRGSVDKRACCQG